MAYSSPEDVVNSSQEQHDLAAAVIDAYCRRSFGQKTGFVLDGSGSDTLYLQLPVISLSEASLDGRPLSVAGLLINGSRVVRTEGDWREGTLNVSLKGVFGYDPAPPLVVEASKRLVAKMVDGSWQPGNFGAVKVGSVSYETPSSQEANIIGDPLIEGLLEPYIRRVRFIPI